MKASGIIISRPAQLRRSLASVKILVELGQEHNISLEVCLMNSGIMAIDFANPAATIDMAQELTVIRNLQGRLGRDVGLGLAAGLRYNVTTFGILGYAVMSSATVRDGLTIMIRYLELMYAFISLRLEEDDREFRIVIDDEGVPEDVRQFLIERLVGGLVRTARVIVGGWVLRGQKGRQGRVEFSFPRPINATNFEQLGFEEIVFSEGKNRISAEKSMLDIPLPQRDQIARHQSLAQCDMQLDAWKKCTSLTGFIIEHLSQNSRHMPDMVGMAAHLAMTTRTLRRRLVEEGTTYRKLVDQVRVEKAKDQLLLGKAVGTVAIEMGFSEATSFIRAYKRWTGTTPGHYEAG